MAKKSNKIAEIVDAIDAIKNAPTEWQRGCSNPYIKELLAGAESDLHEQLFEASKRGRTGNALKKSKPSKNAGSDS